MKLTFLMPLTFVLLSAPKLETNGRTKTKNIPIEMQCHQDDLYVKEIENIIRDTNLCAKKTLFLQGTKFNGSITRYSLNRTVLYKYPMQNDAGFPTNSVQYLYLNSANKLINLCVYDYDCESQSHVYKVYIVQDKRNTTKLLIDCEGKQTKRKLSNKSSSEINLFNEMDDLEALFDEN